MPNYDYLAIDDEAQEHEGTVEANSEQEANELLWQRGLFAHKLKRVKSDDTHRTGDKKSTFTTSEGDTPIFSEKHQEDSMKDPAPHESDPQSLISDRPTQHYGQVLDISCADELHLYNCFGLTVALIGAAVFVYCAPSVTNIVIVSCIIPILLAGLIATLFCLNKRTLVDKHRGYLELYYYRPFLPWRRGTETPDVQLNLSRIESLWVYNPPPRDPGEAYAYLGDDLYVKILSPDLRRNAVLINARKIAQFLQIQLDEVRSFEFSKAQVQKSEEFIKNELGLTGKAFELAKPYYVDVESL